MFCLSKKTHNALAIIKIAYKNIFTSLPLLLFVLLMNVFNACTITGLLYYEYKQYGVHIFDLSTLEQLQELSFWEHSGNLLGLIVLLLLATFIYTFLQFSFIYFSIEKLQQKKGSFFTMIFLSIKRTEELFRYACINTASLLLSIISLLDITTHLTNLQSTFDNSFEPNYSKYNHPKAILLFPILVEEDITIPQALKESHQILEKTFEKDCKANTDFTFLKVMATLFTFIVIGGIMHFLLDFALFTSIVVCILTAAWIMGSINSALMYFYAAVYNFCKEREIGPFDENLLKNLFK